FWRGLRLSGTSFGSPLLVLSEPLLVSSLFPLMTKWNMYCLLRRWRELKNHMLESEKILEINELAQVSKTKIFEFWVYLMTDLVIFAVLFACYIVLRGNTYGGPTPKDLFHFPSVLAETLILLTSSFTCSLGMFSVYRQQKEWAI